MHFQNFYEPSNSYSITLQHWIHKLKKKNFYLYVRFPNFCACKRAHLRVWFIKKNIEQQVHILHRAPEILKTAMSHIYWLFLTQIGTWWEWLKEWKLILHGGNLNKQKPFAGIEIKQTKLNTLVESHIA